METIETLLLAIIYHRYHYLKGNADQLRAMRELSFELSKRYLYIHPDWKRIDFSFEIEAE